MLKWIRLRDDRPPAAGEAIQPAGNQLITHPDLTGLLESECEAHCLCPPPGLV